MLPIDTLALFFAAAVLLGLTPGPDNLFVLTQSALYGRHAGWLITLGLCTGLLVHTAAVALGVAAVFQTSAVAFDTLKLAGAGYLLWLAWHALRAQPAGTNTPHATDVRSYHLYRRGIIMNLTNPKVAIFFLAFLPQFTQPQRGAISVQIAVLGMVFIASTLLVFGTVAMGAGTVGHWLRRSPRVEVWLNRVAGLVFIGLACQLAISQR